MEEFYNDVIGNICLDFGNEEVRDITNGLELLIHSFVEAMKEEFSDFKVERVTRCGSMAEETRIKGNDGLEYDYLLEMNTWPKCGELQFQKSCEGSMQPLYKVSEKHSVCLKTNVVTAFRYNLCQSIKKHCKRSFCPKLDVSDCDAFQPYSVNPLVLHDRYNMAEGCSNCSVFMNTGCLMFNKFIQKFMFVWEPKKSKPYKYNNIINTPFNIKNYGDDRFNQVSVDIHPVLIVTPERILANHSDEIDQLPNTGVHCYLFPNCLSNHVSQCNKGYACWRISHYDRELEMLQRTSQIHIYMFMILKFITKQIFANFLGIVPVCQCKVRSYDVKTAVLHHIQKCKLAEPDIGPCLTDTVELLSKYFAEENLPNAVSEFNVLSPNIFYGEERVSCHLRYQIIGHTFHALSELLTSGIHLGTAGWLKDLQLVCSEVARALWNSRKPGPPHSYTISTKLTPLQVQTCADTLKNYTDQRMWRTVDSLMNEYALKQSRIERLQNLQGQHDWCTFRETALGKELEQSYLHTNSELDEECRAIKKAKDDMPIGCFI